MSRFQQSLKGDLANIAGSVLIPQHTRQKRLDIPAMQVVEGANGFRGKPLSGGRLSRWIRVAVVVGQRSLLRRNDVLHVKR
jgi:hypothetical protein